MKQPVRLPMHKPFWTRGRIRILRYETTNRFRYFQPDINSPDGHGNVNLTIRFLLVCRKMDDGIPELLDFPKRLKWIRSSIK